MAHRPPQSPDTVKTLARDVFGLHVQSVEELDSFEDRNYHLIVDVNDVCNDNIGTPCSDGYVFKVLNSKESELTEDIKLRNAIIQHVHNKGIPSPRLVPSKTGKLFVLSSLDTDKDEKSSKTDGQTASDGCKYAVRLLEYLPGNTLASIPLTAHLSFQVGCNAARLDLALQDFDGGNHKIEDEWALHNAPCIRHYLHVIKDPELFRIIGDVIDKFEEEVLNADISHTFRKGYIHGDLNAQNILVKENMLNDYSCEFRSCPLIEDSSSAASDESSLDDPTEPLVDLHFVCGILDFGSLPNTFLFLDLAIAMSHLMGGCPPDADPDKLVGHVLAGYISELPLSRQEIELLPLAISARFCQIVVLCLYAISLDPQNYGYIIKHLGPAMTHLPRFWNSPFDIVLGAWKDVAASLGLDLY